MVDYRFRKKARGTHCAKGHEFTEENTFTRAHDKARVCKECRKQYARGKYQSNKDKNGGVARPRKDKQPIFEVLESSMVSEDAMEYWIELQEGLQVYDTPCRDEPEFYADRSIEISVDEAELMCYGCPLIKSCYDYAVADKITAGIWGGIHFDQDEGSLFEEEDFNEVIT